jgi:uncharacterized membrane protein YbhN (UPF0104 family)
MLEATENLMRLRLGIILVVTMACLAAVLSQIEWEHAKGALKQTQWWTFGPVLLCYLIAHGFRTLRLGALLGSPIPFRSLFAINSVGFLAINVVPLRLGELVRPAMLVERHGLSFGQAMAAIVMERLLDMCTLLVMLLGLSFWVALPAEGLMVQGIDVIGAGQRFAGVIVALGCVFGGLLVWIGEPAIARLETTPFLGRSSSFVRRFREAIISLLATPLTLLKVVVLTAALWGTTLLGIGVFMWGFPGIPSTVGAVWTTWSITLAGMTALPTPGFFGGYELFCTAALWLLGVGPTVAGTFAITLHLGQFAFTCGLGGFFIAKEGLSLRSLVVSKADIGIN